MVIATIGDDFPESAVVEFGNENFTLVFDTNKASRKYRNLTRNPKCSVVIGWDENKTLQYDGIVSEIKDDELLHYKSVYFEKNPEAQKWEKDKNIAYFKIEPAWVRFTDLNHDPWAITELQF